MKCSGMSWGEVASVIGTQRKSAPTLAKNHMNRFGLPSWNEGQSNNSSSVSEKPAEYGKKADTGTIVSLVKIKTQLETLRDSKDPDVLSLIADIARVSSGIIRAKK